MGGTCSMQARDEECIKHEEKRQFIDLNIDGIILLKWVLHNWCGVVDWIHLAQDRVHWRSVVNMVKNIRVP
jgi:hypothetical protein